MAECSYSLFKLMCPVSVDLLGPFLYDPIRRDLSHLILSYLLKNPPHHFGNRPRPNFVSLWGRKRGGIREEPRQGSRGTEFGARNYLLKGKEKTGDDRREAEHGTEGAVFGAHTAQGKDRKGKQTRERRPG